MTDSSVWTIDAITFALLRMVPEVAAQVEESLDASTEFMDDLGAIEYEDGTISAIEIKAWTGKRVIHSVTFRDGSRLGDLRFRLRDERPIPESLIKSPCDSILGHRIFSGYRWEAMPDDNEALIHGVADIRLGVEPGVALTAILADTRTRHAD